MTFAEKNCVAAAAFILLAAMNGMAADSGGRAVPARVIPVPSDVSPELQDAIRHSAENKDKFTMVVPHSNEEWHAQLAYVNAEQVHAAMAELIKRFPVEVQSTSVAGVPVHIVSPPSISQKNRHRVIVHVHGGAYVAGGGEAGIDEAILLAHYSGIKVVSVDYRMPPEHPFPAALDDSVAVWKDVTRSVKASHAAIGGTSAGGGLTLAIVMKLKELKSPLPGAIFAGTPWADLSNSGDSVSVNDGIDGALSGFNDWLRAAGKLYAGSYDIKNPQISPIYGDFSGFPPTILITGTRDFLLSDTVRVHRKLEEAHVVAELHVFEAVSHGDYVTITSAPESGEAFGEISLFFDEHLGR